MLSALPKLIKELFTIASDTASVTTELAKQPLLAQLCPAIWALGLGLTTYDVVQQHRDGKKLDQLNDELRKALQQWAGEQQRQELLADDSADLVIRGVLHDQAAELSADEIARLEKLTLSDEITDLQRPYFVMYQFLAGRFDGLAERHDLLDRTLESFAELLQRQQTSIDSVQRAIGDLASCPKGSRLDTHVIQEAQKELTILRQQQYEQEYRQFVAKNLDHMELFGAHILEEVKRLDLSVAYVTLNLEQAGSESRQTAEAVLDDLTPEAGRLLIRGVAGSGKSTFFQWAAIQAALGHKSDRLRKKFDRMTFEQSAEGAEETVFEPISSFKAFLEDPARARFRADMKQSLSRYQDYWWHRVPFLLRLRDCERGRLPSPQEFPKLIAKNLDDPPEGWVRDVLKAGRALILLDGVDEVPGEFRSTTLRDDIQSLVEDSGYERNYFLVSTRPSAVDPGWLSGLRFREAEINPLTDPDKWELIDHWHNAIIAVRTKQQMPADGLRELAEKLKGTLKAHPHINRLAENPLMAAMICALHHRLHEHNPQAVESYLPQREAELVERLCSMLLDERDRFRDIKPTGADSIYSQWDYATKKVVVQDLAHHMVVESRTSTLRENKACELIAERLGRLNVSRDVAPGILKALVDRSGVLRQARPATPDSPGTVEFLHNTIKEYLAGQRMADRDAFGALAEMALKPDWLPVILFAAASPKDAFADELIGRIVPQEEVPQRGRGRISQQDRCVVAERHQRWLLALRCRQVAPGGIAHTLGQRLDKALNELTPRTMSDADAIASAGDLALPLLKWNDELSQQSKQCAARVRALRLIGSDQAKEQLKVYMRRVRDDDWLVLDELAQAVNPLEIGAVQRMVQKPFDIEEYDKQLSLRKQIVDLSPLAGLSGLNSLNLVGTSVSDLSPLAGLSGLISLNLNSTSVSDLSPLAGLCGLNSLSLTCTQVSDLSPLAGLSELNSLDLRSTSVRDLSPLAELKMLKAVYPSETQRMTIPPSLMKVIRRL